MAGFQVSINGRFWVSTEADLTGREDRLPALSARRDTSRRARDRKIGVNSADAARGATSSATSPPFCFAVHPSTRPPVHRSPNEAAGPQIGSRPLILLVLPSDQFLSIDDPTLYRTPNSSEELNACPL
jgi:hypothetical protein